MIHFRNHKGHAACDSNKRNLAKTGDYTKVTCLKCQRSDQFLMAESDSSFKLDDGRKWNNLIFN